MKWRRYPSAAALCVLVAACPAAATVVLHGTRVVYPGNARDVTVEAENNGTEPVLVQAWLDTGDPATKPDENVTPFVLTPPLYRLDPKQTQSMRLIYSHDPLPADRESLFWLNVLEVPPEKPGTAAQPNQLRLIFRSRIKVFFRPAGLAGSAAGAAALVRWTLASAPDGKTVLKAENPTPYHVTFNHVTATIGGARHDIPEGGMVLPMQSLIFALPALKDGRARTLGVTYSFIDDYGASLVGGMP